MLCSGRMHLRLRALLVGDLCYDYQGGIGNSIGMKVKALEAKFECINERAGETKGLKL